MFSRLVLLAFLLAPRAAQAFTFDDLKKIVKEKDLRSVSAVIPYLPEDYKKSFTLMSESRSIQQSSAESPRAILFGRDAKLVMAFNGDPRHAGYNRLEVMEFDGLRDRFQFKVISFSDAQTPESAGAPAQIIEQPTNCAGCHGLVRDDLHPVWDVGSVWRGAFGSQDDSFAATVLDPDIKLKAEAYAAFLKSAQAHERYRALDFSTPLGAGGRSELENRPNLRLGLLLTRLQVKRIARQIEAAPNFKLSEHALVSQLIGCQPVIVDAKFRSDIEAALRAFLSQIYGRELTEKFLVEQAPESTDVFAVGKGLGLNILDWPITLEKRTYAIFDQSFTFKELLAYEMFSRLAKREQNFSRYLEGLGLNQSPLRLQSTPASRDADSIGRKLAPRSLAACSELAPNIKAQ